MVIKQETENTITLIEDKYDYRHTFNKDYYTEEEAREEFKLDVDLIKRQVKLEEYMRKLEADFSLKYYTPQGEPVFVAILRRKSK